MIYEQVIAKKLVLYLLFILIFSNLAFAYVFAYPNIYYWDSTEYKVNTSYIKQFYNFTPEYLRNGLTINFVNRLGYSRNAGTYCSGKGNVIIKMYFGSWVTEDYDRTIRALNHELKHTYQCKILNEHPNHNEGFYKIKI